MATAPTFGQRLLESARAHGEMELQQLRLEQRVLRHQTATSLLPLEAQMQRQLQHSQYQQSKRVTLPEAASSSADDAAGMSGRPLALQQQLLQHRLLQKRQILQRQAAAPAVCSEASLRRHMVRQASYKMAQQQQMVPPLPSDALDDDSWLALPGLAAACSLGADPDNPIGKPPAPYSPWHQVGTRKIMCIQNFNFH